MKRLIVFLLVALMALSFVACTAEPSTGDTDTSEETASTEVESADTSTETEETATLEDMTGKRIFFINVWRALDFFVYIEASVKQAAEEYGFEVTCVDVNLDYVKTADYMSQAVIEGYDIIMIDGDESLITAAEEAEAAGVHVINYDTWIGSEEISALVASNNTEMGKLVGDYTVELLKEKKGEVSGVVYYMNFPVSSMQDRVAGFLSAFEAYPDIQLEEVIPSEETVDVCQTLIENVLTANPEGAIDVIFGSNSTTALGAIAAAESANRSDVIIVGIDDEEGQLTQLQDAESCYYATVAQDPLAIGRLCVEAAAKILNGEEVGTISVPAVLVTKENVEEYLATSTASKEALEAYR